MTRLRLYFATDIHGSDLCFRKFVNAGKFYRADVLILGGDITGKQIMPITRRGTSFTLHWQGQEQQLDSQEELRRAEQQLRDAGYYPVVLSPEEIARLGEDRHELEALFERLACESIARWLDLAEERLRGSGIECYISPGNDDPLAIDAILDRGGAVINPEERVVLLRGEWPMISLGTTNQTPWHSPREVSEAELEEKLTRLAEQVPPQLCERAIYNVHVPPYNTPLDRAPRLDEQLRPRMVPGGVEMAAVGSTAVAAVIRRYQPLLALHGHVHESRGSVRLGRTLCLNPGSEYGEGVLRGALVQLGKKGIEDFLLTAG
jgi:Icc-related predicted phosphoesterase